MSIALAGYGIEAGIVVGLAWIARNWVAKSRKDARDERVFLAVIESAQRDAANAAEVARAGRRTIAQIGAAERARRNGR